MDFGDNTNALFPEPNAYIQNFNNSEIEQKKVVFQEPYDRLPTFYIDNDFRKGDCDCIPKPKKNDNQPHYQNPFPFDLKNLLPLLSSLGGNSGGGLSNILSSLSNGGLSNLTSLFSGNSQSNAQSKNNQTETYDNSPNFNNILSSLGGNGLGNILDLLKNFSNNSQKSKAKTIKSSDIIIKDYKRID